MITLIMMMTFIFVISVISIVFSLIGWIIRMCFFLTPFGLLFRPWRRRIRRFYY